MQEHSFSEFFFQQREKKDEEKPFAQYFFDLKKKALEQTPEFRTITPESPDPDTIQRMQQVESGTYQPPRTIKEQVGEGLKEGVGWVTAPAETAMAVATGVPSFVAGFFADLGKGLYETTKEHKAPPVVPFAKALFDIWKTGGRDTRKLQSLAAQIGQARGWSEPVIGKAAYQPKTPQGQLTTDVALAPVRTYMALVDRVAESSSDDPNIQNTIKMMGDGILLAGGPKIAKKIFTKSVHRITASRGRFGPADLEYVQKQLAKELPAIEELQKPKLKPKTEKIVETIKEQRKAKIAPPEPEIKYPENVYMKMPIERVMKDAEIGVARAKEALGRRKTEGKPEITPKPAIEKPVPEPMFNKSDVLRRGDRMYMVKNIKERKAPLEPVYELETSEGQPGPSLPISEMKEMGFEKIQPEPGKLQSVIDELTKDIGEEPPAGMGIQTVKYGTKEKEYAFETPEIEQRFKQSRGLPRPPLLEKGRDFLETTWHNVSRIYKDLPRTREWAEAHEALRNLQHQKPLQFDRALQVERGVIDKLDRRSDDVFARKIILDDLMQEAEAERALPFGFTKELLEKELPRLEQEVGKHTHISDAITKRAKLFDATKSEYIDAMKELGWDVDEMLTKENYFRHQVLQYAHTKGVWGTGKRLKIPKGRGFLKQRKGAELDINTDYLQADTEVLAQMMYDIQVAKTLKRIKNTYDISDKLKADAKAKGIEDWHELITDEYDVWQPQPGNTFYLAYTIPENIAKQVLEGVLKESDISPNIIKTALAKGGRFEEWVIKKELIATLEGLNKIQYPTGIKQGARKILRAWKKWALLSPRRAFKYNARNLSGDADFAFVGNPHGFTKAPQALRELYDTLVLKKPPRGELRDWIDKGGMESTLQAQELSKIKDSKVFAHLYKEKSKDINIFKSYWRLTRGATDFREAILRYANYLDYLEQIKKSPNKIPKNFGASIREEIMGLKDPKDMAFRLSNDLLGPYDEISPMGTSLREYIYPFWSWQELNFKRYIRVMKNAAYDNRLAGAVGRRVLKGVVASPFIVVKAGRIALKTWAFVGAMEAWNHMFFADEEADLPESVQTRPHLVLGRNDRGEVMYFSRLGAFGDFLEWFGLDTPIQTINDIKGGKRSVKEIATDLVTSPINKIVQGISPFPKTAFELAMRRRLFPDVFNPRTIRDRGEAIAKDLSLENEYRAISETPGKPFKETLKNIFIYTADPLEVAYSESYDLKRQFTKKYSGSAEGFWLTAKGDNLYNMKLAHRYGDKKAENKYYEQYRNTYLEESKATGRPLEDIEKAINQGIMTSFRNMHPLSGLNKYEREAFLKQLSPEDKTTIAKAIKFYNDVLLGTTPIELKDILPKL